MNMEQQSIINHENALCIAFVSFGGRELGAFRNNRGGYDVILAELSGEDDLPYELERRATGSRKEAIAAFADILTNQSH